MQPTRARHVQPAHPSPARDVPAFPLVRVCKRSPDSTAAEFAALRFRYAQWPASVKELLRPSMFGQIPFCRKNVYTLIFVVDPGTELGQLVLAYMIGEPDPAR